MTVNATGPISPEEMRKIAERPFFGAAAELRKFDPAWGLSDPALPERKWVARFRRSIEETGTATIMATTVAEAKALAMSVPESKIDWDSSGDDFEFDGVEPA